MARLPGFIVASLAAGALGCSARGPVAPLPEPSRPGPALPEVERDVRIGVVEAADSVVVGSSANFVVTERPTGRVLASGSNGTAVVTRSGATGYRVRLGTTTAES